MVTNRLWLVRVAPSTVGHVSPCARQPSLRVGTGCQRDRRLVRLRTQLNTNSACGTTLRQAMPRHCGPMACGARTAGNTKAMGNFSKHQFLDDCPEGSQLAHSWQEARVNLGVRDCFANQSFDRSQSFIQVLCVQRVDCIVQIEFASLLNGNTVANDQHARHDFGLIRLVGACDHRDI
jgi:hypothetical protein